MELAAGAEFPYLSCNFTGLAAGEPVFQPYALLDYGDTTVGYVGICTPESLTKTDPTYFRDEAGEAVYGFRQGGDGQELYGLRPGRSGPGPGRGRGLCGGGGPSG